MASSTLTNKFSIPEFTLLDPKTCAAGPLAAGDILTISLDRRDCAFQRSGLTLYAKNAGSQKADTALQISASRLSLGDANAVAIEIADRFGLHVELIRGGVDQLTYRAIKHDVRSGGQHA